MDALNFRAVKQLRKRSGFSVYSYFKDSASTAFKRDAISKIFGI